MTSVFFLMRRLPPISTRTDTLFPSTPLFRSSGFEMVGLAAKDRDLRAQPGELDRHALAEPGAAAGYRDHLSVIGPVGQRLGAGRGRGGKGHPISPCSWARASRGARRGLPDNPRS